MSEKSDEPVSQVDPDPVVTPFASKVSEPTTKVKTPVKVPEMIVPQPASAKQEWSIGASEQETKSHKKPLIIGVCALLLLAVGGTVWYQVDQSNQKQAAQTAKSEAKKSEEAKKMHRQPQLMHQLQPQTLNQPPRQHQQIQRRHRNKVAQPLQQPAQRQDLYPQATAYQLLSIKPNIQMLRLSPLIHEYLSILMQT